MSLRRYPAYRPSGNEWLAPIPVHWQMDRLKRRCDVFPSNVDKKSVEGELPVRLCNYTDVYYNDTITTEMALMPATATPEQVEKFTLRAGDTVFTKDSETADDIGIAAYVPADMPGVVCGYHLSIARPRYGVNGAYVKRMFDAAYTKACFAVRANGLTRVGLNQYAVDNVELPWPPIAEQEEIVAFLKRETTKIDTLIAEQEKLLALLAEKRKATISHAVTRGLDPNVPMKDSGIAWLGGVPAHWSVRPIKRVVVSMEQGWSPQCENFPVEQAGEWGVLKVGCVNGGVFNPRENKKLPTELEPIPGYALRKGDVLVSRANTRDLVGSAAVVPDDFPNLLLCDKLYRLRTDDAACDPWFLSAWLASSLARPRIELEATGASSSMLNIGQAVIAELPMPFPPIAEQRLIMRFLAEVGGRLGQLRAQAEEAMALLNERRTALITAAVTGQIDVRDVPGGVVAA